MNKKILLLISVFIILISSAYAETWNLTGSDYNWGSDNNWWGCFEFNSTEEMVIEEAYTCPNFCGNADAIRIYDNASENLYLSVNVSGSNSKAILNFTINKTQSYLLCVYSASGSLGRSENPYGFPETQGSITILGTAKNQGSSWTHGGVSYLHGLVANFTYTTTQPTITTTSTDVDPETENTTSELTLLITTTLHNITAGGGANVLYNGTNYAATQTNLGVGIGGNVTYKVNVSTPFVIVNNTQLNYNWSYNITVNASDIISGNSVPTQNILWNFPRLNITRVYNAFTNASVSNFTGNISLGGNVYNFTTTINSSLNPLIFGVGNYTIYVEAVGYAINNETNYQTLEITNISNLSIRELSFGLYTNNSVLVTVRNEDTNNLITNNVSLTISGNSTENVFVITTGIYLITDLIDGTYNFKFSADNFSSRTYIITVADRSFQNLAAYLTPSSFQTIMILRDEDSSATIEDVSMTMSRLINSSWVIVESKISDITGRAQFSYLQDVLYRFFASHSDYTSKTFDLDPILFSSYNVLLEKVISQDEDIDYSKVNIQFSPKQYVNDAQNNFTIFFASPSGSFETYSFNATFPGGSVAGSGSNAVGENFAADINITGATFFDTINITYTYDITVGENRTYNFVYYIDGGAQGNNTYAANKDQTYGMGIFERVLITTGVVVSIGGTITLFVGAVPGLAVALLFMGIFTSIGFYPLWLFLISAFAGFFLIVKAGSG